MTWHIKMREKRPEQPEVGDAWYFDEEDLEFWDSRLSSQYRDETSKVRLPLWVQLPGGCTFCVDFATWTNGQVRSDNSGWEVKGTPPDLTVHPSINIVGVYHGFIIDGVISSDVEGRSYKSG